MNIKSEFNNIIVMADIEGSSGCWSYEASCFKTESWARACLEMTRDIDVVCRALFDAGVEKVRVKDFHRTGYNILREHLDPRATLVSGYKAGPVPGIGDTDGAQASLFVGFHAASGTNGFLAHTLTSRIKELRVNGSLLTELELFSSSFAPFGVAPVFFSGCPAACSQAKERIEGINTYSINKEAGPENLEVEKWRKGLGEAVREALSIKSAKPFSMSGPFDAQITMRNGERAAAKAAQNWKLEYENDKVFFSARDFEELYLTLLRICYFPPVIEKVMSPALALYNAYGKSGLDWVRKKLEYR